MKKLFFAIGKAALWVLAYYGVQIIVTIAVGAIAGFVLAFGGGGTTALEQLPFFLNAYLMEITLLSQAATVCLFLCFFLLRRVPLREALSLRSVPARTLVFSFLLGIGANLLLLFFLNVIPFPAGWMESYEEAASALESGSLFACWVATLIGAPICEEITFRGLVYTRLSEGMPRFVAVLLASLIFGLMHGQILWMLYAALFGLLLNAVFVRHNSLLPAVCLHMGFNLTGLLVGLLPEEYGGLMPIFLLGLLLCGSAYFVFFDPTIIRREKVWTDKF